MKVPFTSNENHQSSKPVNFTTTTTRTAFPGYEPKSVLELQRSPSPITDKPAPNNADISAFPDDTLQLGDHALTNFEDWESLMKELGLHEDSLHESKPILSELTQSESLTQFSSALPDFPHVHSFDSAQFAPPSTLADFCQYQPFEFSSEVGLDFVDELIRLAECFETSAIQLGQVILTRLNQRLRSPTGKPLQRAAFYFKEALQTLLTGSTRPTHPSNTWEVIQTIKAYKAFSNISPIPMFSSFTANQAALEAVDGSALVHVIDFDVGLGGHWASFMEELAEKAKSRKQKPPFLLLTALVEEEYTTESRLIKENMTQFARELGIVFEMEFVPLRTFELLSFKAIKFMEGEKTVVLLSPVILRQVGGRFVSDLRRVSPHVVVHVDTEGLMGFGASTFRQMVIDGLEFYSTLLESLEAASVGAGGDWIRRIETFVFFPRILEMIGAAGRHGTPWREAFVAAGLKPVGLSQFSDFQAECLLGRLQVRGFHVAKRQAEMLLCWHDRALVATSAWRC